MSYGHDRRPGAQSGNTTIGAGATVPGKRTLTEQTDAGPASARARTGTAPDVDAHGPPELQAHGDQS
jgi:hypothetical protein